MSRLVRRTIAIDSWKGEEPLSFHDEHGVYQIAMIADRWSEMGNWWDGEDERHLLRVLTDDESVFELECTGGQWYVYRIWD